MTDLVTLPAATPFARKLTPILDFTRQPAVRRALPAVGLALALFVAALAWLSLRQPAQRAVFDGLADADKAAVAEALLYSRNANWAEWIDTRLDKPGSVFIAVGAGHLAGAKSVQDYLAQKGITVTRVK